MDPVNELSARFSTFIKFIFWNTVKGSAPLRLLSDRSKIRIPVAAESWLGMVPVRLFPERFRALSLVKLPSCVGMAPV